MNLRVTDLLQIAKKDRRIWRIFRGLKNSKLSPSTTHIAESFGYLSMFEYQNLSPEKSSNKRCHEVCKNILEKGYPKKGSIDHTWITNRKSAKKNRGSWYESDQKIAESYGLKNLFEGIDLERISNNRCHEVCKWVLNNGRTPRSNSAPAQEKSMSAWIFCQRRARTGKDSQGKLFYQSNQKIAESYGLPFLFKPRWTM